MVNSVQESQLLELHSNWNRLFPGREKERKLKMGVDKGRLFVGRKQKARKRERLGKQKRT